MMQPVDPKVTGHIRALLRLCLTDAQRDENGDWNPKDALRWNSEHALRWITTKIQARFGRRPLLSEWRNVGVDWLESGEFTHD